MEAEAKSRMGNGWEELEGSAKLQLGAQKRPEEKRGLFRVARNSDKRATYTQDKGEEHEKRHTTAIVYGAVESERERERKRESWFP